MGKPGGVAPQPRPTHDDLLEELREAGEELAAVDRDALERRVRELRAARQKNKPR